MKKLSLQHLPPKAAHLCLDVEKFILNELGFDPQGKEIILAYSGGADSKALFFILLALAPRLGFTLSLAHLDHGLRESSGLETAAAIEQAAEYGLRCHARRMDVEKMCQDQKIGKEEAGRKARLEFFKELTSYAGKRSNQAIKPYSAIIQAQTPEQDKTAVQGQPANNAQKPDSQPPARPERWIASGHQLNDLAEDILMRLMRGSGWPALGGMAAINPANRIIRPILLISRSRLEEFLESIDQDWVKDPMNKDMAYFRNRVRYEILPLFMRENPKFLEHAADIWKLARLDDALFTDLLPKNMKPLPCPEKIDVPGSETPNAPDSKTLDTSGPEKNICQAIGAEEPFHESSRPCTTPSILLPKFGLKGLSKAMRLRSYKSALEALGPGQPLLSNLLALDKAWEAKHSGATLQFPGVKTAEILREGIMFSANKNQ